MNYELLSGSIVQKCIQGTALLELSPNGIQIFFLFHQIRSIHKL